jgi:hypothetical protein
VSKIVVSNPNLPVTARQNRVLIDISTPGPKGDKGDKGDTGDPGDLSQVTADTLYVQKTGSTPQAVTPDVQFNAQIIVKGDGIFDVRAGTGYDPIGSDHSTAITDAITRASANGGTVLLPVGITKYSTDLIIPQKVGIRGQGSGKLVAASKLLGIHANARLKIGNRGDGNNRGPVVGDFDIDGDGVATNPFYVGRRVSSAFQNMHVYNAAGDNIVVEEAANCTFYKVNSTDCGGNAWVFDYGCGGNAFWRCDTSMASGYAIVFRQTAPTTSPLFIQPQHNVFFHSILERVVAGVSPGLIDHQAGVNNGLVYSSLAALEATSTTPIIRMRRPGTEASNQFQAFNTTFAGNATHVRAVALETAGVSIYLQGLTKFTNLFAVWDLTAGTASIDEIEQAGVTNWNVGAGAENGIVRHRYHTALEITRRLATDTWNNGLLFGEVQARWRILADRIDFGGGVSAPDVAFRRVGANIAGTGTDDSFKTGASTTAARPTAASMTQGAQWFDTTLGIPIWSNGSVWKDAAGNTV